MKIQTTLFQSCLFPFIYFPSLFPVLEACQNYDWILDWEIEGSAVQGLVYVLCCVVSDIDKELYPSLNALPTEGVHKI